MNLVRRLVQASWRGLLAHAVIVAVACGGSSVRPADPSTPSGTPELRARETDRSGEQVTADVRSEDAGTAPPTDGGQEPNADAEVAAPRDPAEREQAAYARARPVFEQHCATCHTRARGRRAALRHFGMDGYPFTGHHATTIAAEIRQVLGASGRPASMPPDNPGVVQGDEIARVLEWADAFDARVAAEPPRPRHTH